MNISTIVLGLVVAFVSVTTKGLGEQLSGRVELELEDDNVWLFHAGLWGITKQYINDEGVAAGFDIDVLNAVCSIAGKNCKVVQDVSSNCWNSVAGEKPRGGHGLMSGWYDGCLGWRNTVQRRRVFEFSDEFSKPAGQVFVTLPGNPGGFDYNDLTGKRIGFVDGFTSNEQCVAANYGDIIIGADIPAEYVIHCPGILGCIEALANDEIDGLFLATTAAKGRTDIEIISGELAACTPGGFALMTRKDSTVLEWFQPALRTLMSSAEYGELCQDIIDVHGDQPGQGPDEMCFDIASGGGSNV